MHRTMHGLAFIAYMLDIFERIDVEFVHDRADIMAGNNDDETFKNRKYMEGNPSDPRDLVHVEMVKRPCCNSTQTCMVHG